MTALRTDVHRPSFLDPAEYEEVGYYDLHPEDGSGYIADEYSDADSFMGNFAQRGRCDHCGAGPLRYIVIFVHHPSGKLVTVGTRCAGVLGLASKSERERRELAEQARRREALATWLAADADNQAAYDFLNETVAAGRYGYGGFYHDLLHKANRWGNLSEKQVAAALRGRDRDAAFAERRAAEQAALEGVAPLAEGRREITGEVVSTKWQESDYGDTLKMLVREDDGNKVWGTVPGVLSEDHFDEATQTWTNRLETLVGSRVTFKAQVTRSNDDEHFGFFKRPTQAQVVEAVAV